MLVWDSDHNGGGAGGWGGHLEVSRKGAPPPSGYLGSLAEKHTDHFTGSHPCTDQQLTDKAGLGSLPEICREPPSEHTVSTCCVQRTGMYWAKRTEEQEKLGEEIKKKKQQKHHHLSSVP